MGDPKTAIEIESMPLSEVSGQFAALVSTDDLTDLLARDRAQHERFAVIDRMREAFADVSAEEIGREAERSVVAARERRRQRTSELTARSA